MRVAFVGMAPILIGKGLGKEIDSFDIVIRTNFYPIPPQYQKDYGTKCDVLSLHVIYTNKLFNVKTIFTYKPVINKRPGIRYHLITKIDRIRIRRAIAKEMGADAGYGTSGINMMFLYLEKNITEFKFFGITGFQDKKGSLAEHNKVKHYLPIRDIEAHIKTHPTSMKNHYCHNFELLNRYLGKKLKEGKITMDQYSREYFI